MRASTIGTTIIGLALAALAGGCVPPGAPAPTNAPANVNATSSRPAIEVTPVKDDAGTWKVAEGDTVRVSVTAPGASAVRLLYRPTSADEGEYVRLKNTLETADAASGRYATSLSLPTDFAGEVWAEATYADGHTAASDEVALRRSPATAATPPAGTPTGTTATAPTGGTTAAPTDVSALSDSVTGGKIQTAQIAKGDPNLRITINIPSFQLSLWQSGKLVKTYAIGVGRKEYPLPAGNRVAREMILNPDWVPPDSEWVTKEEKGVKPGETYESGDPRNPIGDVKIPLGEGILIHEGRESNLGNLVSHGCARMVEKDLVDLVEKIALAENLQISNSEIEAQIKGTERKDIALAQPIPVEITYDTAVVQGGRLTLYPDVYDKGTNTVAAVRTELQDAKVDAPDLDDAAIQKMLDRVNSKTAYVVAVSDIEAGKGLDAGSSEPVVAKGGATRPAREAGGRQARKRS